MRRILAIAAALVLVLSVGIPVWGHPVPDLTQPCSLTVTMETGAAGGSFHLYLVATAVEEDGNFRFVPLEAYTAEDFTDLGSPELADALAGIAGQQAPLQTQALVEGKAVFTQLTAGLYLLTQQEAPQGYCAAEPFLVSLPYLKGESYLYDLSADPKVELEPVTTTPPATDPTEPTKPNLPQTGQTNWPVPILAVAGLGLFALGWILFFWKEKNHAS